MKVCAACCIELPRGKFSNKQWNTKQYQRQCIECIDADRDCILLDKLHDEALFKQPPQEEDCPICFLQLPSLDTGQTYTTCCGKIICNGCNYAVTRMVKEENCPFCRTPIPASNEESIKQVKKRVEKDDAQAIHSLGYYYDEGICSLPQDKYKALELYHYHRAGELGNAASYYNIGITYDNGRGVERDEEKAKHYLELAAMGGDAKSRYNLGLFEGNAGNYDRALKHFMIAVRGGSDQSLKTIKQLYTTGRATKDNYAKALLAYQEYLSEIKSDQRDEAAAFSRRFKYY